MAICGSWPPPAKRCASWSSSSCRPKKAPVSTASAPGPVVNQDLAIVDGRWPRFAAEALAAGFRSVHALPMRLRGTVIGALNLFHVEPARCHRRTSTAAQALADVATIAILQHRAALEAQVLNEQLHQALNSRIVIEQAKGIVAERNSQHGTGVLDVAHPRSQPQPPLVEVAEAVIDGSLSATSLDQPTPKGIS